MESLGPMEELQAVLDSFVEGEGRFSLLLTTGDDELALVVRSLEQKDEASPQDVYFIDVSSVKDLTTYANAVIDNVRLQLGEVNRERVRQEREPMAPLPAQCGDVNADPLARLRCLVTHMISWVPDADEHRMVVALLPSHIFNREAHAKIVGALAPFRWRPAWSKALRLIVRDDRAEPFVEQALRRLGATGINLYTTRVKIAELADATAAEAANQKLRAPRRIQALMQCAIFDTALGRYEEAIDKYGVLYQYYAEHEVTEMQAVVLQGLGDILGRIKRYSGARTKYLQSLDLASDAKSLQLILNGAMLLGDVDMRLRAYDEAEKAYALGADTAEKLANEYARADLLEKCGCAREAARNLRGSMECWTKAAGAARGIGYDERLETVLGRLIKVCRKSHDSDLRKTYDTELRAVRARLKRK